MDCQFAASHKKVTRQDAIVKILAANPIIYISF